MCHAIRDRRWVRDDVGPPCRDRRSRSRVGEQTIRGRVGALRRDFTGRRQLYRVDAQPRNGPPATSGGTNRRPAFDASMLMIRATLMTEPRDYDLIVSDPGRPGGKRRGRSRVLRQARGPRGARAVSRRRGRGIPARLPSKTLRETALYYSGIRPAGSLRRGTIVWMAPSRSATSCIASARWVDSLRGAVERNVARPWDRPDPRDPARIRGRPYRGW
jgi:hypothetical protein